MDFLLKRVPAFSRALGEWDSDGEEEEQSENDLVSFRYISPTGEPLSVSLNQLLSEKPVKKLTIAVGPLPVTFVHCLFNLSDDNTLCKIAFCIPDYCGAKRKTDCTSAVNSLNDGHTSVSLVITLLQTRQLSDVAQRVVVEKLMNDIFNVSSSSTDIEVAIFCSSPIHNFQAPTVPERVPFLRHLYTSKWPQLPTTSLLEPPNLLTGFPAEFFTWCEVHSVKSKLTVAYYSASEVPDYAIASTKEVINCLSDDVVKPCQPGGYASPKGINFWRPIDHNLSLREACISTMCGHKPSKMDQMYT